MHPHANHQLSMSARIFHLFVHGYGTYEGFLKMDWSVWWFIINTAARLPVSVGPYPRTGPTPALLGAYVRRSRTSQMFFAHRGWELTGRNTFYAIIVGCLLWALSSPSFEQNHRSADLTD